MIAVDTNLLVCVRREDREFDAAAKTTVDFLRHQPVTRVIPRPYFHECIDIAPQPSTYMLPSTLAFGSRLVAHRRNCPCSPNATDI